MSPPLMPATARHVVYDVESCGLLGWPWAIGWVALDTDLAEVAAGAAWTEPDPSDWAPQALARDALAQDLAPTDREGVLAALWAVWSAARVAGALLYCDVAYPVDGAALRDAHIHAMRVGGAGPFDGPFPLLDIASMRVGAGLSWDSPPPDGAHHPVSDARWSADRLRQALRR